MSRIFGSLATAAALSVVLAAAPAGATVSFNAIFLNSITHNSLTHNSLMYNSIAHNSLMYNAIIGNAITHNGLTPTGSQLDELNGVAVEAVSLPQEPAR